MTTIPPIDYNLLYHFHPELREIFIEEHEEEYPDWDAVKESDC